MRFKVECYENPGFLTPVFWNEEQGARIGDFPLRLVAVLSIENEDAKGAADVAWDIANNPFEPAPTDADGFAWPHNRLRSMSSGDVVVIHTPDGPIGRVCLSFGWADVAPSQLNIGVPA